MVSEHHYLLSLFCRVLPLHESLHESLHATNYAHHSNTPYCLAEHGKSRLSMHPILVEVCFGKSEPLENPAKF